jgi:hypothetical protein
MLPMIEEIIDGFRAEASLQPSGFATKPVQHVVSSKTFSASRVTDGR